VNSLCPLFSRPPEPLGLFARIHRSCLGYLLPRPEFQLAGACAPAAAAALRRRVPTPAWSPAQPKFQTSAYRVVERPTATSCLGRHASSSEQVYPRPSSEAAVELARRYCLRRNSGHQCIRNEPLADIPHLPNLLHRRSCRIPVRTDAGWSQDPIAWGFFFPELYCELRACLRPFKSSRGPFAN
jgi:hypothetical protein